MRPATASGSGGGSGLNLDVTVNAPQPDLRPGPRPRRRAWRFDQADRARPSPQAVGAFTLQRGRLSILGKRLTFTDGTVGFSGR